MRDTILIWCWFIVIPERWALPTRTRGRQEPSRSGSPSVSGRNPARNPARHRSGFRGPSTRHRTIERDYERDYDCRCECRRSSPIIGSDGADHYPTRTLGLAAVLGRQEAFVTFFLFVAVVPRF